MWTIVVNKLASMGVDDAWMVDSVNAHDVGGELLRGRLHLGHLVDDHRFETEPLPHGGKVRLEPLGVDLVGDRDHQHDREMTTQDRHLRVLDVALVLEQHLGDRSRYSRPIPADDRYGEVSHRLSIPRTAGQSSGCRADRAQGRAARAGRGGPRLPVRLPVLDRRRPLPHGAASAGGAGRGAPGGVPQAGGGQPMTDLPS